MHQQLHDFIGKYELFQGDSVQQIQLQHRLALVDTFQVTAGMRVLEIGCGQGDTTVALAHAVGETGKVVAIDIASGDYGAPLTLAEAQARITASPLGARIQFHLATDFLQFETEESFDAIVLSHCSWYFATLNILRACLKKAYTLAPKLFFAEWDMNFTMMQQRGHFCAISILALYTQYVENDGNVQHIYNAEQIRSLLQQIGYNVAAKQTVDASYLQDGAWEKDYANAVRAQFDGTPPRIQSLVATYYDVMNSVSAAQSLNSFVVIAER